MLFTGNYSYKSSSGTANSSFYASMHSGVDSAAQAKKASSEGRRDGPQRIGGKLGNPLR